MKNQSECQMKILRFDPDKSKPPKFQEFRIPFNPEYTILDSLYYIYSNIDGSLAFRASCFSGYCNVCMIRVNGKNLNPCKHFTEREMVIEPLPGYSIIRDLVVDFSAPEKKCLS